MLVRLVCQVDYPIGVDGEERGWCGFHGGGSNHTRFDVKLTLSISWAWQLSWNLLKVLRWMSKIFVYFLAEIFSAKNLFAKVFFSLGNFFLPIFLGSIIFYKNFLATFFEVGIFVLQFFCAKIFFFAIFFWQNFLAKFFSSKFSLSIFFGS